MSRRASLPGASELFRPTRRVPEPQQPQPTEAPAAGSPVATPETSPAEAQPAASGRVRHDHKITVYFSEDELLALEDANLELRRSHGIRVDRGRIVRVAVAQALADLDAQGPESALVNELRSQ
ncbi:hypothetical protein G7085_18255 [Tessaracoccus sp. HDW20]|uniref:hypothetical protein n=1 Tax=Tessaracoccus coleopterorum TaxID=2714950 RepID=UPI0018D445B5|nr:hypothetical protein [Tessaracoccus coleopterorum]